MFPFEVENEQKRLNFEPSSVGWAVSEFIRRPPAYIARVFVVVLASTLAIAFAYTWFATVPITVSAPGVITTSKSKIPVRVAAGGFIESMSVTENQSVKKDDILATLDGVITKETHKAILQDRDKVRSLIALDKKRGCKLKCVADLENTSAIVFEQRVAADFRDLLINAATAVRDYAQNHRLAIESDSSLSEKRRQITLAKSQLAIIRKRGAEKSLATDVEQLVSKIGSLQNEITQSKMNSSSRIRQSREAVELQMKDLEQRLQEFTSTQVIKSPSNGVVAALKIKSPGQLITAGEQILEIVPVDSPMVAELRVANQDIVKVKPGLAVRIKIDALPHREYGVISGKIESIDVTPMTQVPGENIPVNSFRATVALDSRELKKDGQPAGIKFGMTLEGLVITKKERMFVLGLRKILNLKDSILAGE